MTSFNVFVFPSDNLLIQKTKAAIEDLLSFAEKKYDIKMPIVVVNAREVFLPAFSELLDDFFRACIKKMGGLKTEWLFYLLHYIKNPRSMQDFICGNVFLKEYVQRFSGKEAEQWKPFVGLHFFAVRGAKFIDGADLWGQSQGVWPDISISLETSGYKESIWHEVLHQFSVSDAYDEDTKLARRGCEACWMQYDATLGKGLCVNHQEELKRKI